MHTGRKAPRRACTRKCSGKWQLQEERRGPTAAAPKYPGEPDGGRELSCPNPRYSGHQTHGCRRGPQRAAKARATAVSALPLPTSRRRGRGGREPGPSRLAPPEPVLELPGLAVQAGQQQPGRLPDVAAVHGEAAPVLGVGDGHAHPLHQRWQQHEGPARRRQRERVRPRLLPFTRTHQTIRPFSWASRPRPVVHGEVK